MEQLLVLVSKHRSMVVFSVIHIRQQRNITSTCTSSQSSTLIIVKHFSRAFMSVLYSDVHTCKVHTTWIGHYQNWDYKQEWQLFRIKADFAIKHKSTGGGWSIHWTVWNITFICALPVVEVRLVESTK